MTFDVDELRVKEGEKVDLRKRDTEIQSVYESKDAYKSMLKANTKRLSDLQMGFYAANKYALLVIFQAMDTAGKDGAIRHVMSGVNPQGCQVTSFKHPSAVELEHDFLWRTAKELPGRGNIGIFNRSHYEEVLVARVHPEILQAEEVPDSGDDETLWMHRYESINQFEHHLHRNGTRIIKFFLHLSKKEQKKRLLDRLDKPAKNWKFNPADVQERGFWDEYMKAYEACLGATSTHFAPWYIVPADDKKNARLLVSDVILRTMAGLDVELPEPSKERLKELAESRKVLEAQ